MTKEDAQVFRVERASRFFSAPENMTGLTLKQRGGLTNAVLAMANGNVTQHLCTFDGSPDVLLIYCVSKGFPAPSADAVSITPLSAKRESSRVARALCARARACALALTHPRSRARPPASSPAPDLFATTHLAQPGFAFATERLRGATFEQRAAFFWRAFFVSGALQLTRSAPPPRASRSPREPNSPLAMAGLRRIFSSSLCARARVRHAGRR